MTDPVVIDNAVTHDDFFFALFLLLSQAWLMIGYLVKETWLRGLCVLMSLIWLIGLAIGWYFS